MGLKYLFPSPIFENGQGKNNRGDSGSTKERG
jgi:hypothetical protein